MQGSESVLTAVRDLVEVEHRSAALVDTLAAAEGLARTDGEGLLQRIVSHFQQLFSVPRIHGVLPAMNQVTASRSHKGIDHSYCVLLYMYGHCALCLLGLVLAAAGSGWWRQLRESSLGSNGQQLT